MPKKFRNEILHVTQANAQVERLNVDYDTKLPLLWRTNKGELRKTGWILREFKNLGDGELHKTKGECYAAMFAQLDRKDS
jgi:hypothetical protein